MPYDVRAVANVVIDRSQSLGIEVTNLTMNKILFFVHAYHLAHHGAPLIREDAEAWEHGPVYKEIYRQFRGNEDRPIRERPTRLDFKTGGKVPFDDRPDQTDVGLIGAVIDFYLRIPSWKLVEMSHQKGGPWDQTWNHKSPSNPGMIISNETIKAYYRESPTLDGGGFGRT